MTGQLPRAGVTIAGGTQVILYLDAEGSKDLETVPDLSGMSYRQARDALSYYGLYIQTASPVTDAENQMVSSQSIAPGIALEHGAVITVSLISGDESMLGKY